MRNSINQILGWQEFIKSPTTMKGDGRVELAQLFNSKALAHLSLLPPQFTIVLHIHLLLFGPC